MAENETEAPAGGEAPPQANGVPANDLMLTLSKPIQAHGEEVKIIKWREPTAGDIERAGNPIILEVFGLEQPRVTFDEKKMSAMISTLAQIPPSSVRQIPAGDWNTIAWKLVRFFMPAMG